MSCPRRSSWGDAAPALSACSGIQRPTRRARGDGARGRGARSTRGGPRPTRVAGVKPPRHRHILPAQCGCRRRSEQPPGGWCSPVSPLHSCASASARRRWRCRASRSRRRLVCASRCAARAGATSRPVRCRCGPTWPRTSSRTTIADAQRARVHVDYPIAADRVLGLGELPTFVCSERSPPAAPTPRTGAARPRARLGSLDLVHGAHGSLAVHARAPPRALHARGRADLRGVRHRCGRLLARAHRAPVVRRRRRRAVAGRRRRCGA